MAAPIDYFHFVLCLSFLVSACVCQIELDDKILELRKNGMWLVKFYAPWCGHCRKLEPVYREIYSELKIRGDVIVGRIDATRFSNVATEFNVRGFPTIIFVNGDNVYTHRGDRTKDDIIEFVNKAKGPAVRPVASVGRFNEIKALHKKSVFFLYVGNGDQNDDLLKKYTALADKNMINSYFYSSNSLNNLAEAEKTNVKKNVPTVLVFKDKGMFEFDASDSVVTKEKLETWINNERFAAFPRIQAGGLNDLAASGKHLVIAVLNIEDKLIENQCKKVKKIISKVALTKREKYHEYYQFLWMPDEETANSITLSFLNVPTVIVLDITAQLHFFWNRNITDLTEKTLEEFLDDIQSGKMVAYGGSGFLQKLKRIGFDIVTTVLSIWQASRWLFLLMFGLPTIVISIVCYSLCCMDTVDSEYNSDDEDEDRENYENFQNQEIPPIENPNLEEIDHEKYE